MNNKVTTQILQNYSASYTFSTSLPFLARLAELIV